MYLVTNSLDNIILLNQYVNSIHITPKQVCLESGECMIGVRQLPRFLTVENNTLIRV